MTTLKTVILREKLEKNLFEIDGLLSLCFKGDLKKEEVQREWQRISAEMMRNISEMAKENYEIFDRLQKMQEELRILTSDEEEVEDDEEE